MNFENRKQSTLKLNGTFIHLELLTLNHLSELSENFDPSLFDYYPKPYATAREFVEENLEMAKQNKTLISRSSSFIKQPAEPSVAPNFHPLMRKIENLKSEVLG